MLILVGHYLRTMSLIAVECMLQLALRKHLTYYELVKHAAELQCAS